jgi:uncharacterized protein (TIGR02145 family)
MTPFYGCEKDSKDPKAPEMATLSTIAVSGITTYSASSGGIVTSSGSAIVIARGVCWSTAQGPTIADSKTTDGAGTGTFSSSITDLTPNTAYHIRAYATSSAGTSYGNEITFTANPVLLATLTTAPVTDITVTRALSGISIMNDGGGAIIDWGICWGTTPDPTISNSKTSEGGSDYWTSYFYGLKPSTKYYVRAYLTNSAGTAYGNELNFTTLAITPIIFNPDLTYGSVGDIDGNTYKTIQIGTQVWMAENLRTTKYNDGTSIPYVTDNSIINGFNWYNNDDVSYKATYGALYTWWAATDNRNLCPTGWHVPTTPEWYTLKTYLGGESVVADKVKETGTSHWLIPTSGSNETGFTALPGGIRWSEAGGPDNQFWYLEQDGSWWSTTSSDLGGLGADFFSISSGFSDEPTALKTAGISVRCVKDN